MINIVLNANKYFMNLPYHTANVLEQKYNIQVTCSLTFFFLNGNFVTVFCRLHTYELQHFLKKVNMLKIVRMQTNTK